jgi:hypothetical protein
VIAAAEEEFERLVGGPYDIKGDFDFALSGALPAGRGSLGDCAAVCSLEGERRSGLQ